MNVMVEVSNGGQSCFSGGGGSGGCPSSYSRLYVIFKTMQDMANWTIDDVTPLKHSFLLVSRKLGTIGFEFSQVEDSLGIPTEVV